MIDWIQAHLLMTGGAILIPLAMWTAKKYLPALAKKYTDIFLKAMVDPDIKDPFIKEQVIVIIKASMKIAEYEMQSKAGSEKMSWVVSHVCSKTSLKKEDVQALAQEIYNNIVEELKEHSN